MSVIMTQICTVVAFATFLYSILKSADCFINRMYISQILLLLSGVLSYMSYKSFINSFNNPDEEDYY